MVGVIQNLLAYYIKRILKGIYKKNHQNWSKIKLLTYKNRKHLLWHFLFENRQHLTRLTTEYDNKIFADNHW